MKDSGGLLGDSIAASARVPVSAATPPLGASSFTTSSVGSSEVGSWPSSGISRVMSPVVEYKEGFEEKKKRWNTKNLTARVAVDALAASCAAALVAPLIATIDRYVSLEGPLTMLNTQWTLRTVTDDLSGVLWRMLPEKLL
jgi:hypothetical protein